MPSGHAYGKSLRTVKTCVGSEFCRFGTQDSTGMGIALEKDLVGMWSPHKVKLAVSGCPRNCAESGIKDVGIIAVESGWELYVGGNGGIKTEVAQFFVKVQTQDEVLEYAGAFLQLYREEAFYLERTVHYLARVGLEHARRQVVEDPETASSCTRGCASPCPSSPIPLARARPRARVRDPFRMSAAMTTATITQNWSEICRVEDIPQQGARIVRRPGREDIAVFRSHGDEVFALIDRCPHKGGPLSAGLVHGRSVTCPLHNWVVDLTAARRRRLTGCARAVAVRVEAGVVSLDLTSHGRGGDSGQHPSGAGRGRGGSQRVLLLRHGLRRARAGQPGRGAGGARRRQPPRQPRPAVQQGLALADTVRADHARVLAASWRAGKDEPRKPIGLDQALDIAADRLADAIVRHGPDSVGSTCPASC